VGEIMNRDSFNLNTNIRKIFAAVLVAVIVGLAFVMAHQWNGGARLATAVLWALGFLSGGSLLGFLFGIPRVLQTDAVVAPAAGVSPIARHLVNTNLEQVSDWITKILVGLGLVQLQQFPTKLVAYSKLLARGIGSGDEGAVFAGGIIVYFSVLGFLGGYLITRLFLSRVIVIADQMINPQDKSAALQIDASLSPRNAELNDTARQAAANIVGKSLDQLTELTDIVAWSKAQFAVADYEKAVAGFQKAVQLSPDDVQLRLEYANSLFRAKRDAAQVEAQLIEAYRLVKTTPTMDAALKMKVYRALSYHYLFQPAPSGFTNAIRYGLEYQNDPDSNKIKSGGILVNLACAYGQQFASLKAQGEPEGSQKLIDARAEALKYVKLALALDPKWLDRLRQLLRTDIEKPPGLTDLEVFENDNEFRAALGLPPKAN
jgi:tetratricopeptide (TPR) repeat protein